MSRCIACSGSGLNINSIGKQHCPNCTLKSSCYSCESKPYYTECSSCIGYGTVDFKYEFTKNLIN